MQCFYCHLSFYFFFGKHREAQILLLFNWFLVCPIFIGKAILLLHIYIHIYCSAGSSVYFGLGNQCISHEYISHIILLTALLIRKEKHYSQSHFFIGSTTLTFLYLFLFQFNIFLSALLIGKEVQCTT